MAASSSRGDNSGPSSLNYAEVVFDDEPRISESPRPKRHQRVEYAVINPRPLPSMPTPSARAIKAHQQKKTYSNITEFSHPRKEDHGRDPPKLLYENIDGSEFPKITSSPPRDRNKVENSTENLKEKHKQPIPSPRKPHRGHCIKVHNPGKAAHQQIDSTGSDPASSEESASSPSEAHPHKKTKGFNYENRAVEIVNDLIIAHHSSNPDLRSHSPQPRSPRLNPKQQQKMADFNIFEDAKSMNPTLSNYLLQLPSAPTQKAPRLPQEAAIWWSKIPELGDSNMIEAIWDYDAPPNIEGVISFKKSEVGVKVSKESNGWLAVKIGDRVGWTPVLFWGTYVANPSPAKRGIKNIKDAVVLHENKAWFLGKMTRQEAEDLLTSHGKHRDFLVRESTNRVGDLTLSVKDREKIRHFPIRMTPSGKYDIGKAHFSDLTKVVEYYQANPLFFDDQNNKEPVSLGKPINRPKSP